MGDDELWRIFHQQVNVAVLDIHFDQSSTLLAQTWRNGELKVSPALEERVVGCRLVPQILSVSRETSCAVLSSVH